MPGDRPQGLGVSAIMEAAPARLLMVRTRVMRNCLSILLGLALPLKHDQSHSKLEILKACCEALALMQMPLLQHRHCCQHVLYSWESAGVASSRCLCNMQAAHLTRQLVLGPLVSDYATSPEPIRVHPNCEACFFFHTSDQTFPTFCLVLQHTQ